MSGWCGGVKNFWWLEFNHFWHYNFFIWKKIEIGAYFKFSMGHLFKLIIPLSLFLIEKFFTPFFRFENRCLFPEINSKPKMHMNSGLTTKMFTFQIQSQFEITFFRRAHAHEFHESQVAVLLIKSSLQNNRQRLWTWFFL